MGGRLLYRDAAGRDAAVDLSPDGAFLGRAADCAIRTDDAMVSRKNCKIWLTNGQWQVEDLGSSNGTFVNEVRIQRQPLRHADVVRCGTLQVRFVEFADGGAGASGVKVDPSLSGAGEEEGMVQLKDQLEAALLERDSLQGNLRDLAKELDQARASAEAAERDRAELQKLRAEAVGLRDQLLALGRSSSQQEEELNAQIRVGEQLRADLDAVTKSHGEVKTRADELSDELAARDRQLDRAQEDVQRTKLSLDELRVKLGELEKTKDAGWKELNHRVGELDHLRAVIAEQERLLEERRIGLIALEGSAQELRAEKERLLRELVTTRSERDESRDSATRARNQIEAFEEEHRRLARMMATGPNHSGQDDDRVKLATELREAKVELKTVRAEAQRLKERIDRADAERLEIEGKLAKLDVERAQALEEKQRAEGGRARSEEARARAEAAKGRIDEERRSALEARDAALLAAERERRRATDLGAQLDSQSPRPAPTGAYEVTDAARVMLLEEELAKLGAELALAQAQVAEGHGGDASSGAIVELKRRAAAAYTGINDALSELRTNILLARELIVDHGRATPDAEASSALKEAITVSVNRTEEAKGLLRALREVIEG